MMALIISIILCITFTALGGIHFYWLLGGKWGLIEVVPTKQLGDKAIEPPKIATAIVGIVLLLFGVIYLIKTGLISFQFPNWLIIYGSWFIPSIFIFRAIGDFNYVGFFKKIKDTEFAKADSKWFSPLSLTIGFLGLLLQFIN